MEEAQTYDEAFEMLTTTNNIAPSYVIISGIKGNEGTVIAKGRYEVIN